MNILALDTSTKNFSLAIAQNGKVVRYRNMLLDKVLESSMIPAIEKILKDSKLKFKDLDGYAVGLGPGSFTSLRVGLSTVKAFALATGKPIVGISSLDVMAMNVIGQKADQICTIMDARRKQVYACLFEVKDGALKRKTDYLLTNIDSFLDRVQGKTLFVGDGVPLWRDVIKEKYAAAAKKGAKCQAVFASEKDAHPQARNLSHLAYGRFEKKVYDDVETLVPLYLYTQDCQVDKN
jgi:tRNA threonylcarbamoyladenosine biosynthesis protein TsaB